MANLQKSNPQELYDAIASVTNATNEQVDAFAKEMGLSVAEIASSDPQQALLIEWMAEQKGRAIAPVQHSKPAKRGRKPKSTEVPVNGIQHAQTRIGSEIQAMEQQIDGHLTQWEEMKSDQLTERFEAVPSNIAVRLSEKLGGYSSDADKFCAGIGAALDNAFPLV